MIGDYTNQTATYYPLSSVDFNHVETYGTAEPDVGIRFQDSNLIGSSGSSEFKQADATGYLAPRTVNVGDRIDITGGQSYRVFKLKVNRGLGGTAKMIKVWLELLK